jgi:hypothetical protein
MKVTGQTQVPLFIASYVSFMAFMQNGKMQAPYPNHYESHCGDIRALSQAWDHLSAVSYATGLNSH